MTQLFADAATWADQNCTACNGRGTVEVPDVGGESASTEYCHCWWKNQPDADQRAEHLRVLDLIQEEHDHQPKFFKANYEMHTPRLLEIAQALRAELAAERARTGQRRRAHQATAQEAGQLRAELEQSRQQLDAVKTWTGAHLPCGVCCSHAQATVRKTLAAPAARPSA